MVKKEIPIRRFRGSGTNIVQVPVDAYNGPTGVHILSLPVERSHFREPFFIDSLSKSYGAIKSLVKLPEENEPLARHLHHVVGKFGRCASLNSFINAGAKISLNKRLGFIFHMSRCGSTLAAQMLASNDRFFVLSEPSIVNAVLDPALNISPKERGKLLSASIAMLAKCSPSICDHVFIKFRSWNVLYLDSILKQFPNTHWIFIHRSGLEVLASVLDKPPGWLRSRENYASCFAKFLNVRKDGVETLDNSEYASRMLGGFCRIANQKCGQRGIFLDYLNLKRALPRVLKAIWGIELTDENRNIMAGIARLYSKDIRKRTIFKSDSKAKRKKLSKEQGWLANKFVENERKKLTFTFQNEDKYHQRISKPRGQSI